MSEGRLKYRRRFVWFFLPIPAIILVALATGLFNLWRQSRQPDDPLAARNRYFPVAAADETWRFWFRSRSLPAFTVEQEELGTADAPQPVIRVHSGLLECVPAPCGPDDGRPTPDPAASPDRPPEIEPGGCFLCGGRLVSYDDVAGEDRLTLVGGSHLSLPFTVGTGRDNDLVLRAPGVGVHHLRVAEAEECPQWRDLADAERGAFRFCLDNGGASRSMVVFDDPDDRHGIEVRHGERRLARPGSEVWLGMLPLVVDDVDGVVSCAVPVGRAWRKERGRRDWIGGFDLPAWVLERGGETRHPFFSEMTRFQLGFLFSPEHLADERVEHQLEEDLQTLVDHELLCLERVPAPAGLDERSQGRIAWRDPDHRGCGVPGEGPPGSGSMPLPPLPERVQTVYTRLQFSPQVGRLLGRSEEVLELEELTHEPAASPLLFDYCLTPEGAEGRLPTLRRVPSALLGVWTGTSRHMVPRSKKREPADEIRFAEGSTSPVLEVEAGLTRSTPTPLLLVLANRGGAMGVCGSGGASWESVDVESVGALPLGQVALAGNRLRWTAAAAATGQPGCLALHRSDGAVTVDPPTAISGPAVADATRPPGELRDGDLLELGPLRLRFRARGDVAATTEEIGRGRSRRVYPLGRDAVHVVGWGWHAGGVEGAMAAAQRRESEKIWKAGEAVGLTLRGDLQRIVARELAVEYERAARAADPESLDRLRASAVLLDANSGEVLAVANAPSVDPGPEATAALRLLTEGDRTQRASARMALENHAFLRAGSVGSVHKVATSIALAREGLIGGGLGRANSGLEACGKGVEPVLGASMKTIGCTGSHPVFAADGSADGWVEAFKASCNVFFGVSAVRLVGDFDWARDRLRRANEPPPGVWAGLGGPTRVVFRPRPATQRPRDFAESFWRGFRPGELDPRGVPHSGNGYLETLMLLGHRFTFTADDGGLPLSTQAAQRATGYQGLQYPTVDSPWLVGLKPAYGFLYPTIPGPEAYSPVALPRGGFDAVRQVPVAVGGPTGGSSRTVEANLPLRVYVQTAFGQAVEGSALSVACLASPVASDDGAFRSPQMFRSPGPPAAPPAPLLGRAEQRLLRDGFRAVVRAGGTGYKFFRPYLDRLGIVNGVPVVGGKTGSIEMELPLDAFEEPLASALRRVRYHACGLVDVGATDADWQAVAGPGGFEAAARAAGLEGTSLPPLGFAAGLERCDDFNVGMPRVSRDPDLALRWDELLSQVDRVSRQPVVATVSSSFVAAVLDDLVPRGPETGRGWVLAVIFDNDFPAGTTSSADHAKTVAPRMLVQVKRYLEARQGN